MYQCIFVINFLAHFARLFFTFILFTHILAIIIIIVTFIVNYFFLYTINRDLQRLQSVLNAAVRLVPNIHQVAVMSNPC